MSSPNNNWYSHLVAQSTNDNIYTLLHSFLHPDWQLQHDLDFVVVRSSDLPEKLKNIPAKHISNKLKPEQYCFPGDDYILLHNYQLTEYLHAAKWAKTIEDFEDRNFIELRFAWTEEAEAIWNNSPAYPFSHQPKTPVKKLEAIVLTDQNLPLFMAYELLQSGTDKSLALHYAEEGKAFLDAQQIIVEENTETALQQLARRMIGYNIVAMVYVWNGQINKAAAVDEIYIHHPSVWNTLHPYIQLYLEMLMIKKQTDYLHHLFSDPEFRQRFIAHYEAFISLLVDETYTLTCMGEVVGIINRVNNGMEAYR